MYCVSNALASAIPTKTAKTHVKQENGHSNRLHHVCYKETQFIIDH